MVANVVRVKGSVQCHCLGCFQPDLPFSGFGGCVNDYHLTSRTLLKVSNGSIKALDAIHNNVSCYCLSCHLCQAEYQLISHVIQGNPVCLAVDISSMCAVLLKSPIVTPCKTGAM